METNMHDADLQRLADRQDVHEPTRLPTLNDQARELADLCDERAATLEAEASELTGEDAAERRQMKVDATRATRQYAKDLRGTAELGRTTQTDLKRGRTVAHAAAMGGILVDSRRLNEAALTSPWSGDKQAIRDHIAAETAKMAEVGDLFEHVDETLNGIRQVPFWRLRVVEATSENTDEA